MGATAEVRQPVELREAMRLELERRALEGTLPLALDVKTTAALSGMSPDAIYDAINEDRCPWPVLRVGRVIRIPRGAVLASLGLVPPSSPEYSSETPRDGR